MSNPNPPSGGPPLRALAMILIALAIVFGGIGALSLSKSGSTDNAAPASASASSSTASAPSAAATTTAESSAGSSTTASATPTSRAAGPVDKSVPVRVYNNSTVTGLAAKTASKLESDAWTIAETGNYAASDIAKTTVYYGNSASEETAAKAIAADIGANAEPRFPGIQGLGAGVIVIVTSN